MIIILRNTYMIHHHTSFMIVAVNYQDLTRIQARDSPAIQQVKITLESPNCLNCWINSGVDSTFWIVIHSQMIQLLPPYQWQFQLPCIWYVISLIYQLNCYYASSYNTSSLSTCLRKLKLLQRDLLEDRDDSELNDKLPFDGMLMRQYNFLSFKMWWHLCCLYSRRNLEYSWIRVFAWAMCQGGLATGAVIIE
jgi:hypothetical protein